MILRAGRHRFSLCVSVLALCTADTRAQTVINTLNQPAQTVANGDSLTVTGEGSVVTPSFRGVFGLGNNTVTVETPTVSGGGKVQGSSRGIEIRSASGTVNNSGAIMTTSTFGIGVALGAGGTVDNTGTVSGGLSAVRIQGGAAGDNKVTNSGTLETTGTFLNGAVHFDGVGGTVDNQTGGVISGGRGVDIEGAGNVMNAGQILGNGSNAITVSGGGMVTNGVTGVVRSNGTAISIAGASGAIDNAGEIESTGSFAAQMSAGGTVTNSKTIKGGVLISGGSAATNAITNMNGAIITGGLLTGATLSAGGNVTNNGTITGTSGVNIGGAGGMLTNTGSIGATSTFGTAVSVASGSTIDNSGSITSDNAIAVNLGFGTQTTTLTNRTGGEIIGGAGGSSDAVLVSSSFMIDNDGLIRGQGTSPFFDPTAIFGFGITGTVINRENGIIENKLSGVAIEFLGSSTQTFENSGTVNGDVKLDGGADIVLLKPGSVINGALDGGGGSDSLEFNAPTGSSGALDFDTTTVTGFDGETGRKTGAGTWTLTGTNTTFSPVFGVEAGTLIINANSPGLAPSVQAGATIGGAGTIGNVTIAGTVTPGNSIGTLNVTGDVTFNAGSTYAVEVANDGTSDLLNATGTTTINGGTVSVLPVNSDASYTDGRRYTVITSNGGVSGQFTGVTDPSAFLDFMLAYDTNNVYLTLAKVADFASVAQTYNQLQVAGALQNMDIADGTDSKTVSAALLGLDAAAARAAYDLIQGEIHADSQLLGADIGALFNSMLMNQAAAFGQPGALTGITRSSYAGGRVRRSFGDGTPEYSAKSGVAGSGALPARFTAWGGGLGSTAEIDGDGNAAEWTGNSVGFAAGLEFNIGGTMPQGSVFGAGAGYTRTSGKIPARSQAADINAYHIGLYGRTGAARYESGFSASAAASYAYQQFETTRNVTFAGISRTATAEYDGHAFSLAAEARYGFGLPDTMPGLAGSTIISPLVRMDGRFFTHNGFTESGASSQNLSSGGEEFGQGSLIAGVTLDGDYSVGGARVRPSHTVAYERVIGEDMPSATLALAGSPTTFGVRGPDESRNRLRLGSSLAVDFTDRATLNLSAGSLISSDRNEFSANAALRIRF
jgi:uncharacterized protein with beta-barrel porin domain